MADLDNIARIAELKRKCELLHKIAILAGCVVLETPEHGSSYGSTSYVRRSLIAEIREALVYAGYDMVLARRMYQGGAAYPMPKEPPCPRES